MKIKKTITGSLAAFAVFASQASAEIVLTEDLSLSGYVDICFDSLQDGAEADLGVQEIELALAFTPADSPWSAVAELSLDGAGVSAGGEAIDLATETVTVTYAASDALSFTVGNILSYQGFEAFDATGLYQYSYSGLGGNPLYSAGYAFGASADYAVGDYAVGFWVGDNSGAASTEYLFAYTGIENATVKVIYADDPGYESFNVWASYDYGDYTFAAEYYTDEPTGLEESETFMVLAYKSFGDAGLTIRYVDGNDYSENVLVDYERLTFSPSYSLSDNVFVLAEFTFEDTAEGTSEAFAAEMIYSF
ncbi:MAG: hypothetical protein GWO81_01085 [Verrucomicrobia bacterium]|nr:hypothetical protein [Verrucomicrobiota bacterium]